MLVSLADTAAPLPGLPACHLQSRSPQAVQPHLNKCFDGVRRLEFGKEPVNPDILAMVSSEWRCAVVALLTGLLGYLCSSLLSVPLVCRLHSCGDLRSDLGPIARCALANSHPQPAAAARTHSRAPCFFPPQVRARWWAWART